VANRGVFLDILESGLSKVKILVVGDLILDRTFTGTVGRISPEAPIPVLKVDSQIDGLGGACNVANNLARLGARVAVAGVTGVDPDGGRLRKMLEEKGIDIDSLVEADRVSTRKVRVVSSRQQMLRMDFETTEPLSKTDEETVLSGIARQLAQSVDTVVLSDYGKGVCTPGLCRSVIGLCREREIPVIVDPKGADWDRYAGCTLVTPNLKELAEAARETVPNEDAEIVTAARETMKRFNLGKILVTRSERGMTLVTPAGAFHEPARAREVFDVSGAGDTVVAVMAAFIAAGASFEEAARIANRAAGFVVGKAGTYAIGRSELLWELKSESGSPSAVKVQGLEEAVRTVGRWKEEGRRVVFTNGCFDILHAGHLFCLERARELGDRLVVGLNSDSSVRLLKGDGRPVNMETFRAMLLAALAPVDLVVVFAEETPLALIEALKPDTIVKGGDYEAERIVGAREIESWGGKVVIVPRFEDLSTTRILEAASHAEGRMSVKPEKAGGSYRNGRNEGKG
jgi:D-beta-D-heptose 7-phosphate kinase/D-beta-D-heptose 1-phosphate adenosyltransferase